MIATYINTVLKNTLNYTRNVMDVRRKTGKMATNKESPAPNDVLRMRFAVQKQTGWTAERAKRWCADQLYVGITKWHNWETGKQAMHPAFWELAQTKCIVVRKMNRANF